MKANVWMWVFLLAAVVLGAGWYHRHQTAETKNRSYDASIKQLSEQWQKTSADLVEQKKVNTVLETNIVVRTDEMESFSNRLAAVSNKLVTTEIEMKAAAKAAEEEIARHETRIKELETQNDGLSKTMDDLKGNISSLEVRIADTQQKLALEKGEKEFLLKELKRLQAEKAELERQFNDLAVLREQVRKLKDELSVARRLDWIRRGLYGNDLKGGERLQSGFWKPKAAPGTNFPLNVEIKRDGDVKVNTPPPPAAPVPAPASPAQPPLK